MRKLIFQNMVTVDGFFEGPNHDIGWHNVDAEFNDFAQANLNAMDTLLFGRVTYELMASYWPTTGAKTDDPIIAAKMNALQKVVFSRTLKSVDWENSRLVTTDAAAEVARLKQQNGKDMAIFGSSDLAVSLMRHGLIDEFWIIVAPVILGGGKTLFQGIGKRNNLRLVRTRPMANGNVVLYYQPAP